MLLLFNQKGVRLKTNKLFLNFGMQNNTITIAGGAENLARFGITTNGSITVDNTAGAGS